MRGFLLETSVLERLSGELCDAVAGRAGSQAMLEAIERAGLFLVPLDEVPGWWRYRHLHADLLRAGCSRTGRPGRGAARCAAAWHEEHGLADDALRHAVAAGETVWAARLVERYFDAIFLPPSKNPAALSRRRALPLAQLESYSDQSYFRTSTPATSSASSAQPTAPRPSPEHEKSTPIPTTALVSEPVAPSCQSPSRKIPPSRSTFG
jgi:hypothetical protein